MDFFERFQQLLQEQTGQTNAEPVLLAVSGGVDSMVMLHAFQASGVTFGVAHANFQLRGAASDDDADFVQKVAHSTGVPFFVKRFETKLYGESKGVSTQMAARDLRYAWFVETAKRHGYRSIATAHHLNDSVETALLNFIRGTGLAGLTGISGWRNTPAEFPNPEQETSALQKTPLLRPLLFATREEIVAYARAHHISWREDSSNASDDYARNFLRHQIVPKMSELNSNFLHTAARNLHRLQETRENLDFLIQQFLGLDNVHTRCSNAVYSMEIQKLKQLPAPRRALREILKPHGFTEDQARQLAENLDHTGFELLSTAGWQVLCNRNQIVVRDLSRSSTASAPGEKPAILIDSDDLMVRLPDGTSLLLVAIDPVPPFPDGSTSVLVDSAGLQYPLVMRRWQEGDVFQPLGMGGQSQKLQDYFTNQKLSRIEKEQVWLLCNGDGAIVWVVGRRLDERFKIQQGSSQALKITLT